MKKQQQNNADGSGSIHRYRHDLEQALAMKRHNNNASNNPKISVTPNSKTQTANDHNLSPTSQKASDITLGFRGLDEAERIVKQKDGNKEAALKIYSQSIELLLKYLRPSSSASTSPRSSIDKELATRVHKALDEAEALKKLIKQEQQQQQQQRQYPPTNNTKSPSSSANRSSPRGFLSSSTIPNFFGKSKSDKQIRTNYQNQQEHQRMSSFRSLQKGQNKKNPNPKPQAASPTSPKTRPTKTATTTTTDHASTSVTNKTSSQQQQQLSPTSPQGNQKPKRKPLLDYSKNDPLVQTIKDDLYVDPSQLQATSWDDIAGLQQAKQLLQEAAIFPLVRPDLFTGLRKPQNVLLYGPPGTGKTMLVRAVAQESKCILFCCTASALTSKWHGEGEKLIRTLFRMAHDVAPSILFLDEMDALLSSRSSGGDEHEASRRFKTEFMVQMDGIVKGSGGNTGTTILVIGATNCPWDVDDAVMRRFPRRIYIPLPDEDARKSLLQHLLNKAGTHNLTVRQVSSLVKSTNGFSCSDITSLASDAAFGPLRSLSPSSSSNNTTTSLQAIQNVKSQDIRPIALRDFEESLQRTLKSVSPSLLS
eukprot:CAMPEP_0195301614 /NCGR_PEP_ID=MMETSP0707-20130614/29582_1 /TAXON_ID=33640 /ORGANISM="Asterionellopsis glacialis, Strain CCMP134" /LENGTH=590 /DNA_ID=CAMNT_0040364599 /DNA_START=211 /DNA_END=1980 /DNA_ORIENTATION=-